MQKEHNAGKLGRIIQPWNTIRLKLANSEIICVGTYEKVVRIIRLNPELNTYILDEYGKY